MKFFKAIGRFFSDWRRDVHDNEIMGPTRKAEKRSQRRRHKRRK